MSAPEASRLVPDGLHLCRRVVAVTVHLPELLVAAAGLLQRLGRAGVRIDVLVAAEASRECEAAGAKALDELGVSGLFRHRLALPTPIGSDRDDDLLAAMSELVGFDPEPGVYCLGPDAEPSGQRGSQPSRGVVATAARRIAEVYRLPLVRFTSTPDDAATGLELDQEEWNRKCAALGACANQVTPLTGRREYYGIQRGLHAQHRGQH